VSVFPSTVYAGFETAIHNAVTTVWPDCGVIAFRFHLGERRWRKIQSLGLSRQYGKKDSEVKSALEENILTLPYTTGGSQRLLCVGDFIQSSERQTSGTSFATTF